MKSIIVTLVVFVVFGTGLSGCMVSGGLIIHPEPVVKKDSPEKKMKHRKKRFRKSKKHSLKVPPGHMPPEGMCRLWFYDRPPGHQPPPVSCNRVHRIPYGAVLVRG